MNDRCPSWLRNFGSERRVSSLEIWGATGIGSAQDLSTLLLKNVGWKVVISEDYGTGGIGQNKQAGGCSSEVEAAGERSRWLPVVL